MPTKYLFIVMQINEYDITNEIGEHSYLRTEGEKNQNYQNMRFANIYRWYYVM